MSIMIMEKGENGRPRQFNIIASGANVSDLSIVTNDQLRYKAAEAGCDALLKAQLLTGNHCLPPDAAFELAYRRGFIEKPMKPVREGRN